MSGVSRLLGRTLLAAAGRYGTRAILGAIRRSSLGPSLDRVNHRAAPVSLAAGPAFALGASVTAAAGARTPAVGSAALVAGLGSGAVGMYDDAVGSRPEEAVKGLRGHLSALRRGRVTSGTVKIVGIGAAAVAAAALIGRARGQTRAAALPSRRAQRRSAAAPLSRGGRAADLLIDAGLIAGAANLTNLLDLRPGRALKAGLALAGPLARGSDSDLLAGPVGAASALLPDDLDERVMLGDAGANAWGALLGVAAAQSRGRLARAALLAGIVGLTLASEKVSFTEVIESTPGLRDLDAWGRRPR
ncbi:MAG: hypothetical protein ACRDT8_04960 [Micromonosporaceae bacterium]